MAETVYIGLGSNLGEREEYLSLAKERIGMIDGIVIESESSMYQSAAAGMATDSPAFLNQVIQCGCSLSPDQLLDALEEIETRLGRARNEKGKRFSRTIDLDILMYGNKAVSSARLTIPHPGLLTRGFVLVPLLELNRSLVHPTTGELIVNALTRSLEQEVSMVHPKPTGTHG